MKTVITLLTVLILCSAAKTQNIGIGTASPHPSALLDVSATNKGVLVPRMSSAQRTGIGSPAPGLLVFDTDTDTFWFFNGTSWINNTTAPFSLPYFDEGSAAVPTLTIRNNGSAAGIRGMGITGSGLYGHGSGAGLAGAAIRAENVNTSGIGLWSITNSSDANMVISNPGTGDLFRGFSGPSAGNLVYRVFNNGTLATTGNIGIGTSAAPTARLEVNGTVKIADGTQGSNRVLTSDAAGNASWQSMAANPAAVTFFNAAKTGNNSTHDFLATLGSNQVITVTFPVEYADAGSNYNSSTNSYTVPSAGYYHFHATVTFDGAGGANTIYFSINDGIVKTSTRGFDNSGGSQNSIDMDYDGYFSAGSVVKILAVIPANSTVALRNSATFTGWRIF